MRRKISVLLVIALIATMAVTYFNVGASSSSKPITLSVDKTYFAFGEPIEVDFSGVTQDLQSHDLEIRIEKKRLPDNATYADRVNPGYAQYFDIGTGAASVSESGTVTFQDGGVKHPTSGGVASIPSGAYTLWVIDFTTLQPCSNQINIDVGLMTISTTKTTFAQGEDIVVSYDGLLDTMGGTNKDVELRLDQGHNLAWDFNSRPGSKGYADMLKSDLDGSNLYNGTSGSKTFPDDDVRATNGSGVYVAGTGYPVGDYTLWVMDYYGTQKGIISNRIEISIVDPASATSAPATVAPTVAPTSAPPASQYPVNITTTKTTFTQGENITVQYSGLSSDVLAGSNDDVEIRLDWGWNLDGYNNPNGISGSYAFADIGSKECYTNAALTVTESGSKVFPANDARIIGNTAKKYIDGVGYPAGQYTLWVMDYSPARKIVSNRIEITIVAAPSPSPSATSAPATSAPATVAPTTAPSGAPTLSINKTVYTVGEDIVATYANFTRDLWGRAFSEIDIFKKGDVIGTNPSTAGYVIYNSTATVEQSGLSSGTITFPAADTDRDGRNFPLQPGEYYICLRSDNAAVGQLVEFTVVAAGASASPSASATAGATATPGAQNKPTGDASMFAIVALIMACAGVSIVLIKKNKVKA